MSPPKQPGVYCFKNTVNNKVYIGSAQCLYTRINQHHKDRGSSPHLQNAIKHYGIDSFCITYQVLETKEEALCLEQMLLDYIFKLNIDCYNISKIAIGILLGDYSGHNKHLAKPVYALEVNNSDTLHTFKSSNKAAEVTKVNRGNVSASCKAGKFRVRAVVIF
jgi:predicted GIY-YIG superfamily endonuclease